MKKSILLVQILLLSLTFAIIIVVIGFQYIKYRTGSSYNVTDIDVIYIRNYFIEKGYIDKIDLSNRKYWAAGLIIGVQDNVEYTFICDLEVANIENFLQSAENNAFLSWEASYIPEHEIYDGHKWGVVVQFLDSTEKGTYGDNAYPETWNKMYDAFFELTGTDILLVKK